MGGLTLSRKPLEEILITDGVETIRVAVVGIKSGQRTLLRTDAPTRWKILRPEIMTDDERGIVAQTLKGRAA